LVTSGNAKYFGLVKRFVMTKNYVHVQFL